jgi:hypothetical protein
MTNTVKYYEKSVMYGQKSFITLGLGDDVTKKSRVTREIISNTEAYASETPFKYL